MRAWRTVRVPAFGMELLRSRSPLESSRGYEADIGGELTWVGEAPPVDRLRGKDHGGMHGDAAEAVDYVANPRRHRQSWSPMA